MIRLRNVGFSYSTVPRVLEPVSFEIGAGLTLVLGPNGAGKSTLLKIIAGVERPEAGRVEIQGLDFIPTSRRMQRSAMSSIWFAVCDHNP